MGDFISSLLGLDDGTSAEASATNTVAGNTLINFGSGGVGLSAPQSASATATQVTPSSGGGSGGGSSGSTMGTVMSILGIVAMCL